MLFDREKFIETLEDEKTPELSKIYRLGENAWILINSKGDFSPKEIEKAEAKDFIPVKLGPYHLHTESAAVVACHTINLLIY